LFSFFRRMESSSHLVGSLTSSNTFSIFESPPIFSPYKFQSRGYPNPLRPHYLYPCLTKTHSISHSGPLNNYNTPYARNHLSYHQFPQKIKFYWIRKTFFMNFHVLKKFPQISTIASYILHSYLFLSYYDTNFFFLLLTHSSGHFYLWFILTIFLPTSYKFWL